MSSLTFKVGILLLALLVVASEQKSWQKSLTHLKTAWCSSSCKARLNSWRNSAYSECFILVLHGFMASHSWLWLYHTGIGLLDHGAGSYRMHPFVSLMSSLQKDHKSKRYVCFWIRKTGPSLHTGSFIRLKVVRILKFLLLGVHPGHCGYHCWPAAEAWPTHKWLNDVATSETYLHLHTSPKWAVSKRSCSSEGTKGMRIWCLVFKG